jgi:hypothetical protein
MRKDFELMVDLFKNPNMFLEIHSGPDLHELWHVDFINGMATKVNNLESYISRKPSRDEYPYTFAPSSCNNIESFLLLTYTQAGLNVEIDSSKKKDKKPVIIFTKSGK